MKNSSCKEIFNAPKYVCETALKVSSRNDIQQKGAKKSETKP